LSSKSSSVKAIVDAPGAIGSAIQEVDTPALLVDLDALDFNLETVHARIRQAGLEVRPHAKAHKSPAIALRQIASGAHGICCQKLSEAQVFAAAGVQDILVTNQVVGLLKTRRAACLSKSTRLAVCADHPLPVTQLAAAARAADTVIGVLVEVDIGHGRCGVTSPEEALAVANAVRDSTPHLEFRGIHAFRGSAQHMRDPDSRANAVTAAVSLLRQHVALLEQSGFDCATITGGGTGTYPFESDSGLYTEVQPGSYILLDSDYAANRTELGGRALRQALYGWCSVISTRPGQAVLDGGLKAFSVDQGLPAIDRKGWTTKSLSDEHAIVVSTPGAALLEVGDKVRMIPSHCDPTVNLHDWLIAVRSERVQEVWPIAARGHLF
jgi:D-serine deaminase-like pyridoxal phosphate-dependent protein